MSSKATNLGREVLSRSSKPRLRGRQSSKNEEKRTATAPLKGREFDIPSFKEFMHRQQVISQYRGFMKAIRTIDDTNDQASLKNEVRNGFKSLLHEKDKLAITMALKEVSINLVARRTKYLSVVSFIFCDCVNK